MSSSSFWKVIVVRLETKLFYALMIILITSIYEIIVEKLLLFHEYKCACFVVGGPHNWQQWMGYY